MKNMIHAIKRKIVHIGIHPITIYCLHHVCDYFDSESMNKGDWMPTYAFKAKIGNLHKSGIIFISLTEAYKHICSDWIRRKKYAVLTFDDGYASLKEILPWLEEQKIPVTLFVNGKYLDGQSYRNRPTEKYLTMDDLQFLSCPNGEMKEKGMVEIGSHGWEHTNAVEMKVDDFESSMIKNVALLSKHPKWIPFHAYTWGRHNTDSDNTLKKLNIIPVFIDGMKNYNDATCIHRELLK